MSEPVSNDDNSQNQYNNLVNSYLKQMNHELTELQDLKSELSKLNGSLEQAIQYEESLLKDLGLTNATAGRISQVINHIIGAYNGNGRHYISYSQYRDCEQYKYWIAEANQDQQNIQNVEGQLEQIDPGITDSMIALNQLIDESSKLATSNMGYQNFEKGLKQVNTMINQMLDVVFDQARTDILDQTMKKLGDVSGNDAEKAILKIAGMAIQYEYDEQDLLGQMQNEVINQTTAWQKEKSTAEADLKTWHWYDAVASFFGINSGPDLEKDHHMINAANFMSSFLEEAEKIISPLIATTNPGMQELSIQLDNLKKKFQEFLSGHLTLLQLKDAMIEALTIMVAIIADTSKDASKFDQEMSQGSQAAAQMHMDHSIAQEEVVIDAQKYAAIMGDLMKVVQYLGMAIVFLLNPSAAMALMVAITMILNATGAMGKLQDAISSKLGNVGGSVVTGLLEAVGTAGGAAAVESVLATTVGEMAVQAAESSITTVVESVTEEAAAAATKAAGVAADAVIGQAEASPEEINAAIESAVNVGKAEAKQVISTAVNHAVETAQKKIMDAFLSKTISELVAAFVKGDLKVALQTASEAAAKNAAELVSGYAETAATSSADIVSEETLQKLAEISATEGVAAGMKISEESAEKLGVSALRKFATRAAGMGLASMASTNFLTNFVAMFAHKDKKDLGEEAQIALQLINAILQIVGTIGASGQVSEIFSSPGFFSKLMLGAQALTGGAEGVASAGTAMADFEKAGAVKAIAKDQAGMDVMQFILEQLQKDGQQERNAYAKEMQQMGKSNIQFSMHFNDAQVAQAEALASSAV